MRKGLSGFRIATIRGVDLKIHFSLIFLLLYVVMIASAQFPLVLKASGIEATAIGGSPGAWGVIFALGLFGSVVLHEFGHVIMAQTLGVKVQGVTLMMLGGVSEMEKIPEQRFAEFKVSIVGPLVSFAIAGALFALMSFTDSANVSFFSYWLARVNLVLGIFNLFPAFPLDGGRAFRSLLATRQGRVQATQTAVTVGKGFAWILGLLGLLSFNILLMLVAFFIYTAAHGELYMMLAQDMVRDLEAGQVGVRTDWVNENETVSHAAEQMVSTRNAILPVRTLSGDAAILNLARLKRIPRGSWNQIRVTQVMEKVPKSLDFNERLDEVLPDLASAGALPMVQDGRIIGLVRYKDLGELLEFRSFQERPQETHSSRSRFPAAPTPVTHLTKSAQESPHPAAQGSNHEHDDTDRRGRDKAA